MAGKYDLKKLSSGKFMFNLKASNGQIILTRELYNDKKSAENGIASVNKNAGNDGRFDRKAAKKKEPYFVLKAPNGQTIGKSEMYSTAASMENGIASAKKNADSPTQDNT